MEQDTTAIERAIYQRLIAAVEMWGERAFPDYAPAGTARPHVVFAHLAGGEVNDRYHADGSHVYVIKCASRVKSEARQGAARISELFNDVERSASPLDGGDDWAILSVSREQTIEITEMVDGEPLYQSGNRYRFVVEAK